MPSENDIAVVLLLARANPSWECIERANALIRGGADWETIYRISLAHGVAPLLYKNISLLQDVPSGIVERFKSAYLFTVGDSARAAGQLKNVVETLEERGIATVAVKGNVMADEVFGDISLYPSSDIDILIREKDIALLHEVMETIGYSPEFEMDPFLLDQYEELHFYREGAKGLDFHVCLGKRRYFSVPEEFWWEGLRERRFEGRCYRVLSVENNLLFLGLHLFGHGYAPLKFLVGMAEILRIYENEVRWEMLLGNARRHDALKPLLLSLYLASVMLEAPLPAVVSGLLEKLSSRELRIFRRIHGLVFNANARLSVVMLLLTILQYGRMKTAARMLRWIFPPLREISYRYSLPSKRVKILLYYVINPVLLLLKKRQA